MGSNPVGMGAWIYFQAFFTTAKNSFSLVVVYCLPLFVILGACWFSGFPVGFTAVGLAGSINCWYRFVNDVKADGGLFGPCFYGNKEIASYVGLKEHVSQKSKQGMYLSHGECPGWIYGMGRGRTWQPWTGSSWRWLDGKWKIVDEENHIYQHQNFTQT